jgi:RNA polymerase sigma factor (sigma-70 family)
MAVWWRRLVMRAFLTRSFSHGLLANTVPPSLSSCAAMDSMCAVLPSLSGHVADADDITQDVFVMLWRRPDAWNAGGAAFSTWLYRVVVNRCIDQARRRRLRSWMPFGEAPDPVDDAPDAVSALAGREHLAEVRFMIRALPEKQRVALLLAVQGERSNADIGSILGISEGAAPSNFSCGRGGHFAKRSRRRRVRNDARRIERRPPSLRRQT